MSNSNWETYEQVATYLLDSIAHEFGFERIEGKQNVPGKRTGTDWEIDAKGVCLNGTGFFLIEYRRHTKSRITQEATAAVAYRIQDTGAIGGIIVSPLGLQEGAKKVAAAEGIHSVQLNANCTTSEYIMRFLKRVMIAQPFEAITTTACSLVSGSFSRVLPKE